MVSVRFAFESYTGGPHGAHWTQSTNVHTNPVRELGIVDIFDDPIVGLNRLSVYTVGELLRPANGYTKDEAWVRTGAGPDPKNFRSFNFTSRGLLVRFDHTKSAAMPRAPARYTFPMRRSLA